MNAVQIASAIDEALPDSKIISDLRAVLETGSRDGFMSIQLNTVWTPVPIDAAIEVVKRAFIVDHTDGVTDILCWVTAAVGGFKSVSTGFHEAGFCFVDMAYDDDCVLVTEDFRREY